MGPPASESLRLRLILLFCALALLIGVMDFAASQVIVLRELANYAHHVRQDQMNDWAGVLSALYLEHGGSWNFLQVRPVGGAIFPVDGLVLGHTEYVIRVASRVIAASPAHARPQASWSSSSIVALGRRVGTLFVRPSVSPALARLSGQLSGSFAWLQAGCIILAVTLSTALAMQFLRRVLRPLEQLARAARGITRQVFDLPLPAAQDREIADVLHAFRAMRGYLTEEQEARERLLADVMHELRTPMTIMANQIESAQLGLCDMKEEQLSVLYDEVTRMGTILSDLQQLSDARAGAVRLDCAWVDAFALLVSVRELFSSDCARRGVTCGIDGRPDAVWVWMDRRRMTQVFVNLMSNALRFTPDGGRIEWSLGQECARGGTARGEHARGETARGEGMRVGSVRIAIRDTGPGIAPEHLPHLFDRFYRADNSRRRDTGGSGLGLAIVKEIVELHGGSVHAVSTLGDGATFCVILPVVGSGAR